MGEKTRAREIMASHGLPVAAGTGLLDGDGDNIIAAARGAFADVGHANGGVGVGAQAAEGAFGQIEPGDALAVGGMGEGRRRCRGSFCRRGGVGPLEPARCPSGQPPALAFAPICRVGAGGAGLARAAGRAGGAARRIRGPAPTGAGR